MMVWRIQNKKIKMENPKGKKIKMMKTIKNRKRLAYKFIIVFQTHNNSDFYYDFVKIEQNII